MPKRTINRLALLTILLGLFALITWPHLITAAPLTDGQRLLRAWQQANEIGHYRYRTEVVQNTHPTAQYQNVGRQAQSRELAIAGEIDHPSRRMTLQLQSGTPGNQRAIDLRVEDGVAYGRSGETQEWQEIDTGTDLFAPGGDPLGFLSAAENVQLVTGAPDAAGEDDLLQDLLPDSYTTSITRYRFDLDGQKYAQFMRRQMESYLTRRGELPAGIHLDLVRQYVTMQGSGEIWLDSEGLPLRELLHLTFPAQEGASEWLEAKVTTSFSDWQAGSAPLATIFHAPLSSWPTLLTTLLPTTQRVQDTLMLTAILSLALGFALLCVSHRRSRRFYTLVTISMFVALLLGPLLQAQEVSAFSQRFAASSAERTAQMAGQKATTGAEFRTDFDPQANQLASAPVTDLEVAARSAPSLQSAACRVDGATDSDCDGLSDVVETTKLGADPAQVDSDGDFISDRREVEGFNNGQQWYLDPTNPDSNGDLILDNLECPELADVQSDGTLNSAFVAGVCRNSDNDLTPDLFDFDNDGDGVPDSVDSAPFDLVGDPTSGFNEGHFDFNVSLSGDNAPIFATFEIRPTNPDHLWYTDNVLDWPSNDTAGQIMRVHDNTFADVEGYTDGGKLENGDMILTPLLEFKISYDPANPAAGLPITPTVDNTIQAIPNFSKLDWLDTAALAKMGITVNEGEDDQTLYVWVPLTLVQDSVGDGRVAWSGTMLYRPDPDNSTLGQAQQVRLLWTVQALVDECDTSGLSANDDYDAYCADSNHWVSHSTLIQTYPEAFYITGITVREDHGGRLAMMAQPESVGSTHYEDYLWRMADNLQTAFLGGQALATGSGNFRVSNIPAAVADWGLSGLQVTTRFVDNQMELLNLASGESTAMLNRVFPNAPAGKLATLLFAGEDLARTVALGDTGNEVNGNQIHLALDNPYDTLNANAMLRWAPYESLGSGVWQNADMASYRAALENSLANVFDDAELAKVAGGESISDMAAARAGAILLAENAYLALFAGMGMPIALDGTALGSGIVDNSALALPAGEEAATLLVARIVRAIQAYYGKHSVVAALTGNENATSNTVSASSQAARLSTSLAAIIEAIGTVAEGKASTTLTLALQELGNYYKLTGVNPKDFVQNATITSLASISIVGRYGSTLDITYLAVKTALVLNSFKSAYYFLSAADVAAIHAATSAYANGSSSAIMTYSKVAYSSAAAWAVVTFIVSATIMWTFFGLSHFDNNLQRSAALARTIAGTIVAAIMAVISAIPVVGQLIVAVVALIDLVAAYVCKATGAEPGSDVDTWVCSGITGALTRVIQYLIFDQYIFVDLKDKQRLQITMRQPTLAQNDGLSGFVAGNQIRASVLVTNTISLAEPTGLRSGLKKMQDALGITDLDQILTRSTFTYTVQPTEAHHHGELELDQVAWQNKRAGFVASGTTTLPAQGINQPASFYLTESFDIPAIECWGFVIQFCKRTDYKDSFNTDLHLTFDVLPPTLDGFYKLVAGSDGGYRLGWDDRFPTLADADGDGLRSTAQGGSDPNDRLWDSDGDFLSDLWEMENGANALDNDSDDDGLSDYWEVHYGTNPYQADSDNDGLVDGDEFFHSQTPNAYLADNQAWHGGWAIVYAYDAADQPLITRVSSNPLDYDSDDDSILDNAEQVYGYNPRVPSVLNVLSLNTEVANDVVAPAATVSYSATIKNELDNRIANGLLQAEFPVDNVQTTAVMATLSPHQSVTMQGTANAPAVSATTATSLTLRAGAVIQDPDTGRVLWLHLNETGSATSFEDDAQSSGGPHNATCSGAACPATNDGSLRFNGANTLTVANQEELNPDQFTVSLWVSRNNTNGVQSYLAQGNRFALGSNGNAVVATLYLADCVTPVSVAGGLLPTGNWQNVIMSYDGANLRLYYNGVQQGSATPAASLCANNSDLLIGNGLQGMLDEVELYARALPADEVATLFKKPVFYLPNYAYAPNPVYFAQDGSEYSQAILSCSAVTLFNIPCPNSVQSNGSAAFSFNEQQGLTVSGNPILNLGGNDNTFAMSLWLNPADTYTPDNGHLNQWGQFILGNESNGYAKAYPTLYQKGDKLMLRFGHADGLGYCEATSGSVLSYNQWQYITLSFDGNVFSLYRDGALVANFSGANCAGQNLYPASNFFIGHSKTNISMYFTSFDNVTNAGHGEGFIWSQENEYDDGVGSLPLLWNSAEGAIDSGHTTPINAWSTTLGNNLDFIFCNRDKPENGIPTNCDLPNQPLLIYDDFRPVAENSITTHYYYDTPGAKSVTYSNQINPYKGTLHYNLYSNGFRGQLDEIRLYRNALTTEEAATLYESSIRSLELALDEPPGQDLFADATSNSFDASCSGASCPDSGIPGRSNQAARFDGVDDFLTLPTADSFGLTNSSFTVMAWVKADAFSGSQAVLGTESAGATSSLMLGFNGGKPYFTFGSANTTITGPSAPATGRWVHLAYRYNAATMRQSILVNGVAVVTSGVVTPPFDGAGVLRVGKALEGNYFDGLLDNLVIVRKFLTLEEVSAVMNEAPLLNLHLDEDLNNTLFVDDTPLANAATCSGNSCPQAGSKGQMREAAVFMGGRDGVDDMLTVAQNPSYNLARYTIGVWVKPLNSQSKVRPLIDKRTGGQINYSLLLHPDNTVRLIMQAGDCSATKMLNSVASVVQGQWNHIMGTFDGKTMRLYINGVADPIEVAYVGTPCLTSAPIRIGGQSSSTWTAFDGMLDEVSVYGAALSASEVRAIYDYQAAWVDQTQSHLVTIDVDKPSVAVEVHTPYLANAATMLAVSAVDPTSSVAAVAVRITTPSTNYFVNATQDKGAWLFPFAPTEAGQHLFQAVALDAVGNRATSAPVLVYVDGAPPSITLDAALNGATRAVTDSLALLGAVSDTGIVASGINTGTVVLNLLDAQGASPSGVRSATSDGAAWSLEYPFAVPPYGNYRVWMSAQDLAGNLFAGSVGNVRLDGYGPVADVTLATHAISTTNALLSGTISDLPYPNDGRLLNLHFEESSAATIFADSSEEHAAITCSACPSAGVAGRYGNAVAFDGVNDYLVLPQVLDPSITPFSAAFWFKIDALSGMQTLLQQTDGSGIGRAWLYLNANGQIATNLGGGLVAMQPTVTPNQWVHAAITFDGATITLYLNGVAVAQGAGTPEAADGKLLLGVNKGLQSSFLRGALDEVVIYESALSSQTLYDMANALEGGVSEAQIRIRHAQEGELGPDDGLWQPLLLANPGSAFTTWQQALPAGMEGPYKIDLKAKDVLGNLSYIPNAWSGDIDLVAPRLTFHFNQLNAVSAEVECVAEDFNIDVARWLCPAAGEREELEDAAWFVAAYAPITRTTAIVSDLQTVHLGTLGQYAMAACDLLGNCATATAEASLTPLLTISKTVNNSLPQEGETITYTVMVSNSGSAAATGVVIKDTLAGELANGVTLAAGAALSYTYSWRVGDGPQTLVNTATVDSDQSEMVSGSVTVNVQNVAPVAGDDEIGVGEDGPPLAVEVLENDHDGGGDTLTVVAVDSTGTKGKVSLTDGRIVYDPTAAFEWLKAGEQSTDTFTYRVSDGVATVSATVTVRVSAVNDAPVATDDVAQTNQKIPVLIAVVNNDSDADGDTLTILASTPPLQGSLVVSPTEILYRPAPNSSGVITFGYTVSDGALTDSATVTVTVIATNAAPVAKNDEATTAAKTAVIISVLANDTDPDGDALAVIKLTQPLAGKATLNADQTVTYTPAPSFSGAESFTYTIADGKGGEATAQVKVTVSAPPVASCNLYPIALQRETLLTLRVGQLLANLFGWDPRGSDFEIFTWSGDTSAAALVASLTPPGNSDTYTNPLEPADHRVDIGDWVQSLPKVQNTQRVREAFDKLVGKEIVVPVWGLSKERANNSYHRVVAFARIRLTGYQLPKGTISAVFLGKATCGEVSAAAFTANPSDAGGEEFAPGELDDGEFVDPWPSEGEPSEGDPSDDEPDGGDQQPSSLFLPLMQNQKAAVQSAMPPAAKVIHLPFVSRVNQ